MVPWASLYTKFTVCESVTTRQAHRDTQSDAGQSDVSVCRQHKNGLREYYLVITISLQAVKVIRK